MESSGIEAGCVRIVLKYMEQSGVAKMSRLSEVEYDAILEQLANVLTTQEEIHLMIDQFEQFNRFVDDALEIGDLIKVSDYKFTGAGLAVKLNAKLKDITITTEDESDYKTFGGIGRPTGKFIVKAINSGPYAVLLNRSTEPFILMPAILKFKT